MDKKMEAKISYLEMIQNVIQRMASNSFQLKGWAVTLVGIIGAIAFNSPDKKVFALLFLPLFAFWGLDSYYLMIERRYRKLYQGVASGSFEADFSMNLSEIKIEEDDSGKLEYVNCLISSTELFFYLPVSILVIVVKGCC